VAENVARACGVARERVKPWQELAHDVLLMLKVEGRGSVLSIAVLVVAASLAMANLMVLKVRHRTTYLGVLRALGVPGWLVGGVYLMRSIP